VPVSSPIPGRGRRRSEYEQPLLSSAVIPAIVERLLPSSCTLVFAQAVGGAGWEAEEEEV